MFKRIVKCIASHNDTVIAQENTLMADERLEMKKSKYKATNDVSFINTSAYNCNVAYKMMSKLNKNYRPLLRS